MGNSIGALLGSQNCKRSRLNVTYLVPEKYSQTLISIVSEYFGKLTVIKTYIFASLAQLVESVICNLEVVGSIPTGGSKGLVVQLIEHLFIQKVSRLIRGRSTRAKVERCKPISCASLCCLDDEK